MNNICLLNQMNLLFLFNPNQAIKAVIPRLLPKNLVFNMLH